MPQLPPQANGRPLPLPQEARQIVIVGANGAGKSRFASRMAVDLGERAFVMSALRAIYQRQEGGEEPRGAIARLVAEASAGPDAPSPHSTELERLMWLLMHDELVNLLSYKLRHAEDASVELPATKLDTVIALWQEIFPDNRILVDGGRMLFASRREPGAGSDTIPSVKLSAGEKAVMYFLCAACYAPENSTLFIDSPEMFLHPTVMQALWNRIEQLRPDCFFVYTTHDLDFASTRTRASIVWVRNFDAPTSTWDYHILPPDTTISDEIYASILGARKPVLFIEGDGRNSIDAKLYSLIFKDFTVQPLGSCNKVIEATRTFNTLNGFHKLDSYGIVDRDRRDEKEVVYLRGKRVMVPEVAEVENILMLEDVVRTVASHCGRDENKVFAKVKRSVITQFSHDLRQQALLHTRHRVKRTVEYRVDGRFSSVEMLERHMQELVHEINPRGLYDSFVREFNKYKRDYDYASVLRVYNQKSMLPASNVAGLCGLSGKDEYVGKILDILRYETPAAARITTAIRQCFNLPDQSGENNGK